METTMVQIDEAAARRIIAAGAAGYYEISLRDSISKNPIAHPEQLAVFAHGAWYLVPTTILKVVVHGYSDLAQPDDAGLVARGCLSTIQIDSEHPLCALLQKDIAEKGRPLSAML